MRKCTVFVLFTNNYDDGKVDYGGGYISMIPLSTASYKNCKLI